MNTLVTITPNSREAMFDQARRGGEFEVPTGPSVRHLPRIKAGSQLRAVRVAVDRFSQEGWRDLQSLQITLPSSVPGQLAARLPILGGQIRSGPPALPAVFLLFGSFGPGEGHPLRYAAEMAHDEPGNVHEKSSQDDKLCHRW